MTAVLPVTAKNHSLKMYPMMSLTVLKLSQTNVASPSLTISAAPLTVHRSTKSMNNVVCLLESIIKLIKTIIDLSTPSYFFRVVLLRLIGVHFSCCCHAKFDISCYRVVNLLFASSRF